MQTVTTSDAENRIAYLMSQALKEPIMVERDGLPYVVMMSAEDYQNKAKKYAVESLIRISREMGEEAQRNGLTPEILQEILNSKD